MKFGFQIEDYFGQNIGFDIYDHDRTNGDDFMGKVNLSLVILDLHTKTLPFFFKLCIFPP